MSWSCSPHRIVPQNRSEHVFEGALSGPISTLLVPSEIHASNYETMDWYALSRLFQLCRTDDTDTRQRITWERCYQSIKGIWGL